MYVLVQFSIRFIDKSVKNVRWMIVMLLDYN